MQQLKRELYKTLGNAAKRPRFADFSGVLVSCENDNFQAQACVLTPAGINIGIYVPKHGGQSAALGREKCRTHFVGWRLHAVEGQVLVKGLGLGLRQPLRYAVQVVVGGRVVGICNDSYTHIFIRGLCLAKRATFLQVQKTLFWWEKEGQVIKLRSLSRPSFLFYRSLFAQQPEPRKVKKTSSLR